MATNGGAGGGGEKSKRGSIHSSSVPQSKKSATKPSLSSSSSSSQRPIRNNPKPTITSNLDPSTSRIPRRSNTFNNSTSTTPKPASVNRRRSFDMPPSSIEPQKALRGPTNTPTRDIKTSSTVPKTSIKPPPQRSLSTLSAPRPTKPAAPTPSIRRSLSTKSSPNTSISVRKVLKKSAPLDEAHHKDPVDEHEVQSLPEISEMPGFEDHLDDPSTSLKENIEEKHVVVELEGSKEGKEESKGAEELVETESPAKQRTQSWGKREVQAYNDVIEETKNKLMENRRNRVLALAGAFETVISLDSK